MGEVNTGRAWAYTGVALGATVSVAANIAHSYVRPDGEPKTWSPETGAVIGAAFWPLALAVSSEVLARNSWTGRRRLLGIGGVVLVASVAAVVSYLHLKGLLAHYGEPPVTALIGPLAVDGLMLTSTTALIAIDRSGADAESIESIPTIASTGVAAPAPVEVQSPDPAAAPPTSPPPGRGGSDELAPRRHARRPAAASATKPDPAEEERRLAELPGWVGMTPPDDWQRHVSGAKRTRFRRLDGAKKLRQSGAGVSATASASDTAAGSATGAADSDDSEREVARA